MNSHQLFEYQGMAVRVLGTTDEPLFVATDVCRALGLVNASKALQCVPPEERGITSGYTQNGTTGTEVLILKEAGLYRLIFRSDKPAARLFQDWVFREVLPSIRKHRGYVVNGFDLNDAYRLARTGAAQIEVLKLLQRAEQERPDRPAKQISTGRIVDLNQFWDAVITLLKAGRMSREYFRLINRRIYFLPAEVLKLAGDGLARDEVREALVLENYWVAGQHKQRFSIEGKRSIEGCWCVEVLLNESGKLLDLAALLSPTRQDSPPVE